MGEVAAFWANGGVVAYREGCPRERPLSREKLGENVDRILLERHQNSNPTPTRQFIVFARTRWREKRTDVAALGTRRRRCRRSDRHRANKDGERNGLTRRVGNQTKALPSKRSSPREQGRREKRTDAPRWEPDKGAAVEAIENAAKSEIGPSQGGIVSPALANRALDGLQSSLERRFSDTRRKRAGGKVHLVRYADDFIVTGTSQVLLRREVQPLVEHFLRERGLELSHEKTRITHIEDGFDFLGQTVRRFGNGKILIKPSKRSIKTFLAKIQATIDDSGGRTAGDLIRRLNQQIKGWTMYHRYAVE